jgi:hypothetical protein
MRDGLGLGGEAVGVGVDVMLYVVVISPLFEQCCS